MQIFLFKKKFVKTEKVSDICIFRIDLNLFPYHHIISMCHMNCYIVYISYSITLIELIITFYYKRLVNT